MTRQELSAQAANVQRAVESALTCTPATVESLKTLLLPEPSIVVQSNKLPPSKAKTSTIRPPKSTSARLKKQPAVNVLDTLQEDNESKNPQQKLAIATGVVNVTLQALAVAAKGSAPQEATQSRRGPLARTSSNSSVHNGSTSRCQTPLQAISVNRITNSPSKGGYTRRSSSDSFKKQAEGLRAQAQCARIAFSSLRLIQAQEGSRNTLPFLQVEMGMSALIHKLIALGFDDLALKELCILRKRLESIRSSTNGPGVQNSDVIEDETLKSNKTTIAGLLLFRNTGLTGQLLSLVITTQIQVIRILSIGGHACNIEAAAEHLGFDVAYSPANLILQQIDSASPHSKEKAAQQLENLAQALHKLSINSSFTDDNSNRQSNLSAQTALKLQLLVLGVRTRWWALAGHQINISEDIVKPLTRSFETFRRRCKLEKDKQYHIARNAFLGFSTLLEQTKSLQQKGLSCVYQILADLAQESLEYPDAILWVERALERLSDCEWLQSQRCSLNCQLTTLRIRADPAYQTDATLVDCLRNLANSIVGDLHGESSDLDELLIRVTSLRRTAFSVFQHGHKCLADTKDRPSDDLIDQSRRVVLLTVRFLIRYIGSRPSSGGGEKPLLRYKQRRKLASQVAAPTLESICTIAKVSASDENWDLFETSLRECVTMAQILEDSDLAERQSSEATRDMSFASISSAYWFRYLNLKKASANSEDLEKCIRASIDLIKNRTSQEKIAGLLLVKLEHCCLQSENVHEPKRTLKAYEEAIVANIDLGVVSRAAEAAIAKSLPDVFDMNEDLRRLGRLVLAYLKVTLTKEHAGASPLFFDANMLPNNEKGLLLEYQFTCLVSILHSRGPSQKICTTLHSVTDLLLSIYAIATHPVRRLYVVIQLLFAHTTHTAAVKDSVLLVALDGYHQTPSIDEPCLDEGLQMYSPHLIASLEIFIALREKTPNVKNIQATLGSWCKVLQQNPDWPSIRSQVYDVAGWLLQLQLIVEYLAVHGLELLKVTALHILVTIHEALGSAHCLGIVSSCSDLGLQYATLGYSGLSGVVLQKAQQHFETSNASPQLAMKYHLSYATHALNSHDHTLCKDHLQTIWSLLDNEAASSTTDKSRSGDRYRVNQLIADAYRIQSTLATAEGRSREALLFARLRVKIQYHLWAATERRQSSIMFERNKKADESVNETLANSMLELSLSEQHSAVKASPKRVYLPSAAFWSLVPQLFQSLLHLSQCFAHNGLFSEATYHLEESQRLADAFGSSSLSSQQLARQGQYTILAGDPEKGVSSLQAAGQRVLAAPRDRAFVSLQIQMATSYAKNGQFDASNICTATAKDTIQQLMTRAFLDSLVHRAGARESLETQLGNLCLEKPKPAPRPRTKKAPTTSKGPRNAALSQEGLHTSSQELPPIEVISLSQMKGEIFRECAVAAMSEDSLDTAAERLQSTLSLPTTQQDAVRQALLVAEIHQRRALKSLLGDPVLSVVAESTVSCPSTSQPESCTNQKQESKGAQKTVRAPRKPLGKAVTKKSPQEYVDSAGGYARLLHLAQDSIADVLRLSTRVSSTMDFHHITDVLRKILMIQIALLSGSNDSVSSIFVVFLTELGRMISMKREALAIDVERQLVQQKDLSHWPPPNENASSKGTSSTPDFELATFQADYVDIIPQDWIVITMSLSESFEEISISRIRARRTPFVIKIPLSRRDSLEDDEEPFGFTDAKRDLRDIVDLANHSAQVSGDLSGKGAKTQWWDTRASLDARLKDLLNNIESIWIGGFRGMFSKHVPHRELLARFQQSLQNILDKYLPSRQRTGKAKENCPIVLDSNVIELFVGLGEPNESNDIDEPLMDLLYFVVDILQFNGERNAYDEIELDSIVVETTDALRHYHQAAYEGLHDGANGHTILVLDKNLHCFPWESMNCLKDHSLSRLPSLACLRRRILEQRDQQKMHRPQQEEDRFLVDRHSGAFILNPGGDLTNTQNRFEEPLQELSSWECIIQRTPDEAEMKDCLGNHELFLYFGHGSGSQYIRSRTIKRLEKCAVALLMGCSSGALTEAGEFEPYGTPISYMHAGCPALLATLWDVTDKDIDRFSQAVLEKWGLFQQEAPPVSSSPVKKSAKPRGKAKAKEANSVTSAEKKSMSLDSAVAKSRESCILRYLNGAAPVVYGIPVFLS